MYIYIYMHVYIYIYMYIYVYICIYIKTPGHGGFIQLLQNGERAAPLASVGVPDVDVVGRSVLLEALGGHQACKRTHSIVREHIL